MEVILDWILNNVGLSILISAVVGPLIVGSVLDLWLRPKIEVKKNKLVLINNLKEESIALTQTIIAGLTFVYKYDRFIKGDGGLKSRSRVLTLQLENDYERLKELNVAISRLSSHFNFEDDFTKSTVAQLAVMSGNIMRIRDTVEERKFELFNGINKKTLGNHIDELESLQHTLTAKTKRRKLRKITNYISNWQLRRITFLKTAFKR